MAGDAGDMIQTVVDLAEELLVTVLEQIRERPSVVLALAAAAGGALVGVWLAARGRRKPAKAKVATSTLATLLAGAVNAIKLEESARDWAKDAAKGAGRAAKTAEKRAEGFAKGAQRAGKATSVVASSAENLAELAPVAMRVLNNPLVRSYLQSVVRTQVKKRFR